MSNYKPFRPQKPSNITFVAAKNEFVSLQRMYGIANNTIRANEQAANRFIYFAGTDLKCNDISLLLLESYGQHLAVVHKLKAATINSYLKRVGTIIKFSVSRGYIPNDFIIPIIKTK